MKKRERLNVRISERDKKSLARLAKRRDVSMSEMVAILIRREREMA